MKTLILALLPFAGWSQALTYTVPNLVKSGVTVTVPINISGSSGKNITGVQATVTVAPAPTSMTISTGAASTTAAKTVTCNVVNGSANCIWVGLNQNIYADGVLGSLSFPMPTASITVSMTGSLSASTAGAGVATTASSPFTVAPLSPCDLNADGKIDSTDLTIAIQQAIGSATGITADLNGDGIVNIIDVTRIANAGSGGACVTGP